MSFAAKGEKKAQQNQRQTNTSHSPTKTISINHTSPLKEKGGIGAKPLPKWEGWGKVPQFRLFLCLYSWLPRRFSTFYSPHPKPLVPNRAPPSLLGGYSIGKNHFLQNWKIKVVFPYILLCWITFLLCILSIGSLWKSEIGRTIVLLKT